MEIKNTITHSTETLTSDLSMSIYDALRLYGNVSNTFLADATDFDRENIVTVNKQVDSIRAEIEMIASGRKVLEAAIPATYNDDGEIVTEAIPTVYYEPIGKGKVAFKAEFDGGLYDELVLLSDYVSDKGFDYGTQFEEWLESYN